MVIIKRVARTITAKPGLSRSVSLIHNYFVQSYYLLYVTYKYTQKYCVLFFIEIVLVLYYMYVSILCMYMIVIYVAVLLWVKIKHNNQSVTTIF